MIFDLLLLRYGFTIRLHLPALREPPRSRVLLMPRRSLAFLFSAVCWTVIVGVARLTATVSSGREQSILRIQQLIENQDLTGARRLLAESIKNFPNDAGFENLLGVL